MKGRQGKGKKWKKVTERLRKEWGKKYRPWDEPGRRLAQIGCDP